MSMNNLSYRCRRYMKKKILSLFLAMLCIISLLSGCGGKETENAKENTSGKGKTPVTLNGCFVNIGVRAILAPPESWG